MRKRLGGGSFGELYSGENQSTNEQVAVKIESMKSHPQQLHSEYRIYKIITGAPGFPSVKWYGVEGDYNVLVMELLGNSIENMFNQMNKRFSLKTTLMIADQMLERVQYFHKKGLIHRDIKPDNFSIGFEKHANQIYLFDFGLSKKYKDFKTNQHIPFREGRHLTGTARYASVNTHYGIEQSRRDDLESVAYSLIYLMRGSLPWQGFQAKNKQEKYDMIIEKKVATPVDVLCAGMPQEFATFLTETRKLDFTDEPDYAGYRKMFRDLFVKEGFVFDYDYDWNHLQPNLPYIMKGINMITDTKPSVLKPTKFTPPVSTSSLARKKTRTTSSGVYDRNIVTPKRTSMPTWMLYKVPSAQFSKISYY